MIAVNQAQTLFYKLLEVLPFGITVSLARIVFAAIILLIVGYIGGYYWKRGDIFTGFLFFVIGLFDLASFVTIPLLVENTMDAGFAMLDMMVLSVLAALIALVWGGIFDLSFQKISKKLPDRVRSSRMVLSILFVAPLLPTLWFYILHVFPRVL